MKNNQSLSIIILLVVIVVFTSACSPRTFLLSSSNNLTNNITNDYIMNASQIQSLGFNNASKDYEDDKISWLNISDKRYNYTNSINSINLTLNTTRNSLSVTNTTANNAMPKSGGTFTAQIITQNITISNNAFIKLANITSAPCNVTQQGALMYNFTVKRLTYCNSTNWVLI